MPTGYGGQSQQRWGDNTVSQNEFMRDIQLVDTTGKVCATTDARKKGMLVLAFFETGSADCRTIFPYLQRLADAYKESGKLTVWGVSEDDEQATRAFAESVGLGFPLLLDRDGYHALVYGLTNVPTVYLADGGGTVLRKFVGVNTAALSDISGKVAAFAGVDLVNILEAPALV